MNICAALENLLQSVADFKTQMFEKANAERKEYIDLFSRMTETHETLTSLAQVCSDAGDTLIHMGADILPVASLVGDVLDGDNIPSIDYEKFMGVCEDCGKDISVDDDYSYNDEGDLLCPDCANLYYAIDEDEDEDEEEIPEENVPV
jgi:hypothetical protein